jgi:hypothetical protein
VHCGLANYHVLVRTVDGRVGWAARWLLSITSLLSPLFLVVEPHLVLPPHGERGVQTPTEDYHHEEKQGQPSAQYFQRDKQKAISDPTVEE